MLGNTTGRAYEPFTGSAIGDRVLDPFCNRQIEYDVVIIHLPPEYYPYWIKCEPNKRLIGCTVWETDKLPKHWPPLLNKLDRILVPCHWNKDVFQQCGVTTPVEVIPHILTKREPGGRPGLGRIRKEDFVFYTIGEWTYRKAIWNTVKAYLNEFTSRDPVVLLIKTTNYDETKLVNRRFLGRRIYLTLFTILGIRRGYKNPARIKLVTRRISEGAIGRLHQRGDCYVSLTHSEGWGLGAFDAAGLGKPVIMTGFGGQLDYLSPELAYLVDFDLVPVHESKYQRSFTKDQNWAVPRLDHASTLMRHVFENQEEARDKGRQLGEFVSVNFDETEIIPLLLSALTK